MGRPLLVVKLRHPVISNRNNHEDNPSWGQLHSHVSLQMRTVSSNGTTFDHASSVSPTWTLQSGGGDSLPRKKKNKRLFLLLVQTQAKLPRLKIGKVLSHHRSPLFVHHQRWARHIVWRPPSLRPWRHPPPFGEVESALSAQFPLPSSHLSLRTWKRRRPCRRKRKASRTRPSLSPTLRIRWNR